MTNFTTRGSSWQFYHPGLRSPLSDFPICFPREPGRWRRCCWAVPSWSLVRALSPPYSASWAWPKFGFVLAPSERYYLVRKRRPNKLTDRARQLLWMVKRWLPEWSIVVVADSSFAALNLLAAVREPLCVVTRLRLDAALYDPAPARAPDSAL
ncbi:hypothetical protein [Janthinobacterium sp. PSPC2-1]|uniref:hypothetical protein n=1 Tax=unclassified Janthinobacterium TaxID=2610881 RepID=UPI003CEB1E70